MERKTLRKLIGFSSLDGLFSGIKGISNLEMFVLINLVVISSANPFIFFKIVSERIRCDLLHCKYMGRILTVVRACTETQLDHSNYRK